MTSENCSVYNPCGSFGYCQENGDGTLECQCKFWWTGSRCNKQSSSGIQVIILASLLVVVLLTFYGLSIYCSIRRKKQGKIHEKPRVRHNDATNSKWMDMVTCSFKKSSRCSFIFILIMMVIISIAGLITKRSLLQRIHDELVDKYIQGAPLFYNRHSLCNIIDMEDFNMLTFPLACFVILVFIIVSKRTSFMKNKLKGHVAPVVPIDFYIHIDRKYAAVIFAIIADELLDIVNQVISGTTSKAEGVILVYLLRIAKVLYIGFRYYPVLSAVYIDSILSLLCGALYAWFDFTTSVFYQGSCQSDFYPSDDNFLDTNGTDLEMLFKYYGTGQNLIIIQLLTDVPRYICWSYILIKLPILLVKKIHKTLNRQNQDQFREVHLTREERILLHSSMPHAVEMIYVRNLFRPISQRATRFSLIARSIPKFIYQWRDDFRFSTCIICIYSSTLLLLYFMTAELCILIIPKLASIRTGLQDLINTISGFRGTSTGQSDFPLPDFVAPYVIAILTACAITLLQLLVQLANIRRNLFQVYRGDDAEIPKRNKSSYLQYSTNNFHFAGYFIGYLIWGYIITAVFVFLIYVSVDAFITFGSVKIIEKLLKPIIPLVLLIVFKLYINKLLARYAFLQQYGDILAIDNRRVLMIFLYFNFFLDSFLGFVSSLVRIIKSVIGGCLYLSRIDYSPLGRKLEHFDAGFSAYCGFIQVEATHRNPIMLAAASYLYRSMKIKYCQVGNNTIVDIHNTEKRRKNYSSKVLLRWHLASLLSRYTLLLHLRKHTLSKNQDTKKNTSNDKNGQIQNLELNFYRSNLGSEINVRSMDLKFLN